MGDSSVNKSHEIITDYWQYRPNGQSSELVLGNGESSWILENQNKFFPYTIFLHLLWKYISIPTSPDIDI